MPYKISIPDVCDRSGCDAEEATKLLAMATKLEPDKLKLPNILNRLQIYKSPGEPPMVLAQAQWYQGEVSKETD